MQQRGHALRRCPIFPHVKQGPSWDLSAAGRLCLAVSGDSKFCTSSEAWASSATPPVGVLGTTEPGALLLAPACAPFFLIFVLLDVFCLLLLPALASALNNRFSSLELSASSSSSYSATVAQFAPIGYLNQFLP